MFLETNVFILFYILWNMAIFRLGGGKGVKKFGPNIERYYTTKPNCNNEINSNSKSSFTYYSMFIVLDIEN